MPSETLVCVTVNNGLIGKLQKYTETHSITVLGRKRVRCRMFLGWD